MRSWPKRGFTAILCLAAAVLPASLHAQAISPSEAGPATSYIGRPEITRPVTTNEVAQLGGAVPSAPAYPASSDFSALPPWPPPKTNWFGRLNEDLSKPLTPQQKLKRAILQALFPGVVGTAAAAGFGMAVDTRLSRDYGMGARGFLRRWASGFGDNAVGSFVGDFAMASLLHQDPRYHPCNRRGFGHRLGHALAAVVVTQSDTGQQEFNASHLTGIVFGSGVSTAWHRASDRRAQYFAERVGSELAGSAGYNIVTEFVFHRKDPRH